MPRPRPIAVEPLEPRLQFAVCPAALPVIEHTLSMDFAPAASSTETSIGLSTSDLGIEITLEDGTIVPAEPPDADPNGTSPVIDFGAIARNQQATARAFLIKNLRGAPLTVGDITLPEGFVLLQSPTTAIAPGESGKVVIGLDTTASGGYVGPVVVASDNPSLPLLSFRISGEVLPPPISIASIGARRFPTSLVAGSATPRRPVAVTLHNETDLPFADSVSVALHASSDATLDAADTKLVELVKPLRLRAGQSRTLKLMLSPNAFPAGDATVLASVTASDATDTATGPQVSVRPPFVSLASRPASAPTAPAATVAHLGRPVPLFISISNDGNVPTALTPATFTVAVSTDGSAENVVSSQNIATKLHIAPGQTRRVKLTPTFPAAAAAAAAAFAAGDYQLRVTLNAESNQTNDTFLVTLPVQFA
jgi:hypothetical protein